jgi:hypothetical protein
MVLWNLYGPTEATIWATWQQQEQVGQAVRIGRPMPGVRAYILDGLGEPVPIGVPGELLLGGKCLARGYHKRPTLTAERFIADPFVEEAGARMYRTGDRARWHRDGTIEYLGRTDFQVKLRGHRIELGEIEAALVRQPGVAAAAVLVREDAPGDQRLVGYVVPATGAAPEEAALRAALRDILPAIMVPTAIVTLDKFPQTPNGKLDRKALPAPSGAGRGIVDAFVLPRTPMEEELAALWSRVLGLGQVGVEDDFFDLGGNSLLALRMMAEVERAWGQRLSFRRFFERPTVATLAEVLVAAVTEAEEAGVPVLQPDGGGTPLFFVHGDILAHGWYCRRLAPLLGTAPLVVLPTCGPDTPGQPLTIEAMARFHLETLRRQQPSGPYRLAGYCHGGLVAYEMARQLVALGERVEHLVLIDGFAMNLKQRYLEPLVRLLTAPPTSVEAVTRLALVRYHFFYLGLRWPKLRQGGVVSILRAGIRFVARRAGLYRGATAEQASVPSDELAPGLGIVGAFVQRAQRAYMPGPYSGRVDLIWASGVSRARWPNGSCGWDQVAAEVHVHVTEGSHTSIVLPEGLPGLAERLREVLTGPGLA